MRFAAVVSVLALVGCGGPVAGPPDAPEAQDGAGAALESEAAKVCADLTGYSSAAMQEKPAETRALFQREFNLCVEAVGKGETPGPALRGKTDAL